MTLWGNYENFSPYPSASLRDIYRGDPAFDRRLENTIQRLNDRDFINREDYLFSQTHAIGLARWPAG